MNRKWYKLGETISIVYPIFINKEATEKSSHKTILPCFVDLETIFEWYFLTGVSSKCIYFIELTELSI